MTNRIEARFFFIIALDDSPGCILRVTDLKVPIFCECVAIPEFLRRLIDRREFILLQRICLAILKSLCLLSFRDRKIKLYKLDPIIDQDLLEGSNFAHEFLIITLIHEAHNWLDPSTIIPASIEEYHLSRVREMLDIPLKIPLSALNICRLRKCDDARTSRIQELGKSCDTSSFPCCITSLEDDEDAFFTVLDIFLELHELELKLEKIPFICDLTLLYRDENM